MEYESAIMALADETFLPGEPERQPVGFRNVPWLWGDLFVGLGPLIVMRAASDWLAAADLPAVVRWLVALLSVAWLLGYPLWIARRRHARLPWPSLRAVAIEAAFAVPAILVLWMALAVAVLIWILLIGGPPPQDPLEPVTGAGNWVFAVVFTLVAAIVAPITEDVFFRGMIYNGLRQRVHPVLAAILSAAAFGLMHNFGYVHAMGATLIGLALAVFYEWRRTLLAPIFVHALQNLAVGVVAILTAISAANAPVLGIQAQPGDAGCHISEVTPQSGADEAGLRAGDVIVSLDGEPVADIREVREIVRAKRAGDRVAVEFVRAGETRRVEVILKPRPK